MTMAGLQRLSQNLQHTPVEFGKPVQKQHAVMGEGDFAGLRTAAPAHQRWPRSRVMRLTEGSLRPTGQGRMAGDRLDRCDLQRLKLIQRRQQAGQAAGEQGFAGAGRAAEQRL